MIDLLFSPEAWLALLTLSVLEIVLGIDNVIFISILVAKLPEAEARVARQVGLSLALIFRIALLASLTWLMQLTTPVVAAYGFDLSWRDLILIGGGLFLIAKSTHEIHGEIEAQHEAAEGGPTTTRSRGFAMAISQVVVIDIVFSLDSIITAIGMAQELAVMVAAVIIAVIVMYVASAPVSRFVMAYPTIKMLALAFLLLIGVALVADGFDFHIPRGYIYFAMLFSAAVETFNLLARKKQKSPL